MQIRQQVAATLQAQASQSSAPTKPEWDAYALGWVVGNTIVAARYAHAAIDALPVYHPEHAWDRFLLTRRVSCALCGDEPADAFGLIMLTGDDAPLLARPDGTVVQALGALLRQDPEAALAAVQAFVPTLDLVPGDHTACWHTRAPLYPTLYSVITDLMVRYPMLTVAREVFVDDELQDGMYHPLFLHTATKTAAMRYDWFALQTPDAIAYVHISGEQTIYLRDDGNWSTVRKQLSAEEPDGMARRILAWLRLEGAPDEATID